MGHVWVDVEIFNTEKTKEKKTKGLVDTGATLTTLPKNLANELGIEKISEEFIQSGAGNIKIERGRAIIKDKEEL